MDLAAAHERARRKGVNRVVYAIVRSMLVPFFRIYFRLERIGREHLPAEGPLILAANHRSFLDPFVIGTMARRPVYYVAKRELFRHRMQAWILNALGAFPVDRGRGDADMIKTAKAILARGEPILIFPEGTRTRPGALGRPRRGVGRLALETGAPVVPVAVIGTEAVRRGWRIRPHRVRVRAGRRLTFPRVEQPSRQLAAAVTERIWPCVMLQWEWLGGIPPLRRAAVLGADRRSLTLATLLSRAGMEVEVGARSAGEAAALAEQAAATSDDARAEPRNGACADALELPEGVRVRTAGEIRLDVQDLVCFGGTAEELPGAVAARAGEIQPRAGVVVLAGGFVAPQRTPVSEYVARRVRARGVACIGGPLEIGDALRFGSALVVASTDRGLGRELVQALCGADVDARGSDDVAGTELASCAARVATVAAAAAAPAGTGVAGAAAGKVFAEVDALARRRGLGSALSGVAGTGELVARLLEAGSAPGAGDAESARVVLDLAEVMRAGEVSAPAIDGLAAVVAGRAEPGTWTATVIRPDRRRAQRAA